ncbi:hypothetical protein, partial [Nocardioides sp.]|uniref:hypothetical protein n=1 Tax=Nocardioides sp. TaxID=35761 RepID=UPI0027346967
QAATERRAAEQLATEQLALAARAAQERAAAERATAERFAQTAAASVVVQPPAASVVEQGPSASEEAPVETPPTDAPAAGLETLAGAPSSTTDASPGQRRGSTTLMLLQLLVLMLTGCAAYLAYLEQTSVTIGAAIAMAIFYYIVFGAPRSSSGPSGRSAG